MELQEAKQQFIQAWGTFGSNWGINRTMAQIHALLLISPDPLSTEEIMEELTISRGNTNMNVRGLIDWGIVEKVLISGERKEYFKAEKDIWKISTQIARERKKRELEPVLKVLNQVSEVQGDKNNKEFQEFKNTVDSITKMAYNAESLIDGMIKAEENRFFNSIIRLFR
jgi:DNA-binding transcriptional regulator GbsR (MarR family)